MIDKLNSTFKTDFYHKNREQKQENSVCAPVQNHHHTDAKIPAATYKAYHGINFKGRQKNDEAALITACRSAIDSIEKTSPSDTVTVKEAVEILKPLNLSEQKLLDYLLGCSYDSHNENVEINKHAVYKLLSEYYLTYSSEDNKEDWFNRLKTCAAYCGFADMKTYKANPTAYAGNIADASNIIRVAITGRANTPDLHSIMKLLGVYEVKQRIAYALATLEKELN